MNHFRNLLFLLSIAIPSLTSAQIYINEWMASNSSTIADPDFDATGDWIELFNDYNDTLDLSGHYLTDNFTDPARWSFPMGTKIAPNGFLLIWADGESTGLHSNFKLTKDGEEIGLYNADTLLIDSIIYSFQETDISMGRTVDGSNGLSFFPTPTPGSSNATQPFDGITYYRLRFSVKGGFYDAPFEVALTAIDGEIRYTLDGSLPTLSSLIYSQPIFIDETTNLRARVFQPNFIPSKPVTHTYFFETDFKERGLPVVSISTNSEYFWDADIGLYVQDFKPEWEYPINIELFENDGSDRAAFNELAGIKINGQNSWELPQKMLGIYFDNEYDNNNLDYQLFFDRKRNQFDNFILRASGSDWSFTLFRDGLCQGLASENMDIEKAGFRPAIAYVNGEYMGIHNLRSRVDESFIEDNFGYGNNEYDLIENNGEVEEGDTIAFAELFALFENDLTDAANFQAVDNQMDVQNFTDYFITQIWSSNSSWGHNIKMWKPKTAGTKWRWILQDLDRSFSGSDNNLINYFTTDNNPSGYNWARRPLLKMLENDDYARRFAQRFTDQLYTSFHPERVTKKINEQKALIENEVPYHVNRWAGTTSGYGDGIASVQFWENEVQKLITYSQERQGVMIEDLRDEFNVEDAVNLGVMSYPSDAGQVEINSIKIPEPVWSGSYFKNMPFELEAVAGVGHQFEGWSAAVFETVVGNESEWKYLDDGSDQGKEWQKLDFVESGWQTGQAELGYGEGDENTTLSFGNDPDNKQVTSYFRKTFFIENVAEYSGQLVINLKRDDGAVIYLNGQEIIRSNMLAGLIDFATYASDFVGGNAESVFYPFFIQTDQLSEGENLLAVEIHQATPGSSDVSFDLELKALKLEQNAFFSTQSILEVNLSSDTFLVANFLPTGECLLPRTISQNTTLTIDCSPYLAPGDVTILENINLTVEAGVEIHFLEAASLIVHGGLQVQGKEDAPVLFKAIEGTDQWGNVSFHFTTEISRLDWLEIMDASSGEHPIYENAAISGFYTHLEMDHIKIDEVRGNPVLARYSDISLKNSQLHSEITGDLINVKYGNGFIENCDFWGNDQPDTDAIDYDEVENGVIRNSKIHDFFGFNSDGIDLGEESQNVLIENNFIHNCTDKGISIGQMSDVLVKNTIIVNCNQGVAVKDLSTAEIDQSTFYNVATPVACFEKNNGSGGGMAFVGNSILSNSPENPFLEDAVSSVLFSNTLSDTGPISGVDVLFGNPNFDNPTTNVFQLKSNSPAIGAGVDDLGNTIDLGTKFHEFDAAPSILISAINYHPVDEESEFLQLYNAGTETLDLTGYSFTSGIGFVFPNAQIAPNETILLVKDASLFPTITEQLFAWTSGKLANSGEALRLTDAYGIIVDQVIYDDALPWDTGADGQGGWLSLIGSALDNHFAESWEVMGFVAADDLALPNMEIRFFPNPASGFVKIQSEKLLIERVEVFNVLGQRMFGKAFSASNEVFLNLENLNAGVWFLKVNGEVVLERLVIYK